MTLDAFEARGWVTFPASAALSPWVQAADQKADGLLADADVRAANLRHGDTWFVGVDVMDCAPDGSIDDGPALAGAAAAFAATQMSDNWTGDWGRGQLSVTFPGYPRQDPHESDANHRFRKRRDAAHLDGLLPQGPQKRRFFKEPHGIILGIALDSSAGGRAPLVVWEGSHHRLHDLIADVWEAVGAAGVDQMSDIDLTEKYAEVRKSCFEDLARVEIPLAPGEAVVLHRALLHGVAPWTSQSKTPRRAVYFRPELPSVSDWCGPRVRRADP